MYFGRSFISIGGDFQAVMIYKSKTYLDVIAHFVADMHEETVHVLEQTKERNEFFLARNKVLLERRRNYLEFRNILEEILELIKEMEEEIEKS